MKRFFKILVIIIVVIGFCGLWYFADNNDYFKTNFNDLTTEQEKIFRWQDGDDGDVLMERYRQHFTDMEYSFPRQKVSKIKMFKNLPMIGVFTGKTLKNRQINYFIQFCNDSANFDWGETTWGINESEYFFRLYDSRNKVIGKIYFCLYDCGMTHSRPLCPSMKFGGLSSAGFGKIYKLINDKNNWE